MRSLRATRCSASIKNDLMGATINKLALIAISFAVNTASAFAADMAVKAVPKTTGAPFNWSGCYIGGHFGGTGGHNEISNAGDLAAAGFPRCRQTPAVL